MMKIKTLLFCTICSLMIFSGCKKEDPFDEQAQFDKEKILIADFVAKSGVAFEIHQSGIYYKIIEPGTGVAATGSSSITINYVGTLLNGTVFDQTTGTPRIFTLGGLIAGWQIGIPLVKKGGKIRLIIPSYYGYGNYSPPGSSIPENSILDFTIEVVNIQ